MNFLEIPMLNLIQVVWPDIRLYDKQCEIIQSVDDNDRTVVPAGNKLGKDFVSGLIALAFFLTRHPCRVVTTSVSDRQLSMVLWGEINRFIRSANTPLPLKVLSLEVRKMLGKGRDDIDDLSYIIGSVARVGSGGRGGEALLGHHLPEPVINGKRQPRTLMVYDESSGVPNEYFEKTDTWAHRTLIIGNPFPCTNSFKTESEEGDLFDDSGNLIRKVIRIRASDSPNVRRGLLMKERGIPYDGQDILEGVLTYDEYLQRRATWDPIRQCISLDAQFYRGSENLLYPPEWLNAAEQRAEELRGTFRVAKAIGVDPAEGGDSTVWTMIDEHGVICQISDKTPDTSVIVGKTILLMKQYNVPANAVCFDAGGGGKQHVDILRAMGWPVEAVAFGEAVNPPVHQHVLSLQEMREGKELRQVYVNRRAEMAHRVRLLIDPTDTSRPVFGIPASLQELRYQMSKIPYQITGDGKIALPPKRKSSVTSSRTETLEQLIGHSPDEFDSLILAVHSLFGRKTLVRKVVALV